jgi:hypothetical protein
LVSLQAEAIRPATCFRLFAILLCVAASLSFSTIARGGFARDYLNAPIDSWLTTYNASYSASVTPEDGMDISSRTRSNVFGQSLVVTRTMDYWGRTGGLSVVLPSVFADVNSSSLQASTNGVSDGFLWQMNIFGGCSRANNPTSPINPRANRWTIFPTINYSYTPNQGRTWLETYLSAIFSRTISIFA